MAKDSLARGAKSAQFSAGQAKKDDPVEFHGTVATEEWPGVEAVACCPHGQTVGRVCVLCSVVEEPVRELKTLEELAALYAPMNDRVLLRRVTEKSKSLIELPDAFVQQSDLGVVIAVGEYMLVGGEARPIPLKLGDKVRVGHYNIEDVPVEGETLMLVAAYDVRLKLKA
jgi:co-chaperonin GroES (HSP10)